MPTEVAIWRRQLLFAGKTGARCTQEETGMETYFHPPPCHNSLQFLLPENNFQGPLTEASPQSWKTKKMLDTLALTSVKMVTRGTGTDAIPFSPDMA